MPITCYTGLPRSGKTYQVVSHVIVAALRQGRRVVTNIAGINEEAIRAHLMKEGVPEGDLGEIVQVTHEQVAAPLFFRTDTDAALGVETFVQPGDLVALDEVWRFWKKRGEIPDRHMNFFRMHGQMPHPVTGLICEVALISQSIRDINENIREVAHETYRVQKDTAIGSDKSYLVVVYSRGSEASRDEIRRFKGFYNPAFFGFYKSHSQATEGTVVHEKGVDDRGNIFKGVFFRYVIPIMLVVGGVGVWRVVSFFKGPATPPPTTATAATPGTSAPGVLAVPAASASSSWRVVGLVAREVGGFVLLEKDGIYRREYDLSGYSGMGYYMSGKVDGSVAAPWSGSRGSGGGFLK